MPGPRKQPARKTTAKKASAAATPKPRGGAKAKAVSTKSGPMTDDKQPDVVPAGMSSGTTAPAPALGNNTVSTLPEVVDVVLTLS